MWRWTNKQPNYIMGDIDIFFFGQLDMKANSRVMRSKNTMTTVYYYINELRRKDSHQLCAGYRRNITKQSGSMDCVIDGLCLNDGGISTNQECFAFFLMRWVPVRSFLSTMSSGCSPWLYNTYVVDGMDLLCSPTKYDSSYLLRYSLESCNYFKITYEYSIAT